jgi:hypothetical protein
MLEPQMFGRRVYQAVSRVCMNPALVIAYCPCDLVRFYIN